MNLFSEAFDNICRVLLNFGRMSTNSCSINTSSFLALASSLVILLSQGLVASGQSCEFPVEIQTEVAGQSWKRDWRGEVRNQFTQFTLQIAVHGGVLRINSTDPRHGLASVTRRCTRVVLGDRFLVAEEDAGGNRRGYTCLRFVVRSAEIVQIWSANLSRTMDPELCSDASLQLDKWLTVDRARLGVTRVQCPLEGGYTIRVFDKARQRGICDAWEGETRLESECNPGDGLTFLFRTQRCVPEDMFMYATQATHCLAAWNEGHHTFVVIRHDYYDYTWLLRFPASQSNSFTSYLFKDLIADPTDIVTDTYNYLRLDTTRDAVRSSGDLCYDDYERCTVARPPCTGDNRPPREALDCPLKCGLCRASSPQWCRLRPEWMGKWDAEGRTNNRSNSVTINGTTMVLHSHHHSQNLRCVEWQPDNADSNGDNTNNNRDDNSSSNDVMFVSEFTNGCRPRFTCARIQNLSSASMLNVTLSKTVAWPFVQNPGDPLDCSGTAFKPRTAVEVNRTRILLLHARTSQHPVNCNLPFRSSKAQIRFRNATTCSGRLAEAKGRRSVELSVRGCSASAVAGSSDDGEEVLPTIHYALSCLESVRLQPNNDLVVTMRTNLTNSSSAEIYCLVFPAADETTFHLLSGSDACQQVFRRGTGSLDRIHLLGGTLSDTVHRPTTALVRETTALRETTTSPHRNDVSTVETDRNRVTTESVSRTSHRLGGVQTPTAATSAGRDNPSEGGRPEEEDATDATTVVAFDPTTALPTEHPIVVGFAAVLFGIIQGVIFICKCF